MSPNGSTAWSAFLDSAQAAYDRYFRAEGLSKDLIQPDESRLRGYAPYKSSFFRELLRTTLPSFRQAERANVVNSDKEAPTTTARMLFAMLKRSRSEPRWRQGEVVRQVGKTVHPCSPEHACCLILEWRTLLMESRPVGVLVSDVVKAKATISSFYEGLPISSRDFHPAQGHGTNSVCHLR